MGMTDEELELHDTLNQLQYIIRDLDSSKVVLVGDLMMDQYIHGYANNLNSRAPVPVLANFRTMYPQPSSCQRSFEKPFYCQN